MYNEFSMRILAISGNEAFARSTISAFCLELNPTLEQINDIKTAVSEAITNCIVHAYNKEENKFIDVKCVLNNCNVTIIIEDNGCGIDNIEKAMQPFFTTKPEQERSGMGFTLMDSFMDKVVVESAKGKGTKVILEKIVKVEE